MTDPKELMKQTMMIRGFSPSTQKSYLNQIRFFETYHQKPAESLNSSDAVREYLYHLISVKNISRSQMNIAYSSLKFFFHSTLGQDWVFNQIPRTKKDHPLPVALSRPEVRRIFAACSNLKHKTILMTIYGGGLRISEAAHLFIRDIDSHNMQIHVRHGKGNVDRFTILSNRNLLILREYWRAYQPSSYLFPNSNPEQPLHPRSIQKIFHEAKLIAGILKPASVHSLRHSFATHLLEDGVNIRSIQHFMGHSNITTTCRYLHLISPKTLKILSPLDSLEDEK